jgi:tRNA A-37 threonylcarbamoyl transferase component Bud32
MASVARIGTDFAGYRIEALVGRGGTSTVYRAENPRLGIRIALKVLNPDVAQEESFRERFVRESRLAAGINHPNIITIYDAGVAQDTLYIAMKYVEGGDLKRRVGEGPLAPDRTVGIVSQVASALDAAHARGLIHRDVKPANVMVDSGHDVDSPEIAYVTDFGLIKHVHSGGRATGTGEFLGTIDYVAPEQIEGKPVDARADVYSLACVAYECLTGQVPFKRDTEAAVLWAHMQEPPPAATALMPGLPRGVDSVLATGMAKSPGDRFSSGSELVAGLRSVLEPGTARRAQMTVPLKRPTKVARRRGRRWARAALVAAGLALGAAGAATALLLVDGRGDPAAETVTTTNTVLRTVQATAPTEAPAYIPEAIRRKCRAAPPPTPDFDQSFLCRPARGIEVVRYSHAFSGPLLSEYFVRRVGARGLPVPGPGERLGTFGSCDARLLPAVEEWRSLGRAGHEAIGRTELGDSDGRVLCHETGGFARIEWTTPLLGVYAHAYGRRYDAVYAWWRTTAGPVR